ncbi:hypothetical protein [Clostridium sp.]|uniref:hypothetical protein n=1 Tax=Clostridium sp. TaxID=1506 RepID=UPI00260FFA63|nr:hypothetical protein [uncultured Clostridium sp.]
MWQELRRVSSLTKTEIERTIDKDSRIKVFIKDEEIRVECNGKSYGFSRGEFERRPRGVVGRIIEIGKDVLS